MSWVVKNMWEYLKMAMESGIKEEILIIWKARVNKLY